MLAALQAHWATRSALRGAAARARCAARRRRCPDGVKGATTASCSARSRSRRWRGRHLPADGGGGDGGRQPRRRERDAELGLAERQSLRKATVVAIGEGRQADDCSRVPMGDIAVGQEVILSPYSGAIQADPKDSDSPLYLVDVSGLWATSG